MKVNSPNLLKALSVPIITIITLCLHLLISSGLLHWRVAMNLTPCLAVLYLVLLYAVWRFVIRDYDSLKATIEDCAKFEFMPKDSVKSCTISIVSVAVGLFFVILYSLIGYYDREIIDFFGYLFILVLYPIFFVAFISSIYLKRTIGRLTLIKSNAKPIVSDEKNLRFGYYLVLSMPLFSVPLLIIGFILAYLTYA